MLERDVENRLVRAIKKLGGIAYKFTSPGRRSVPDRLVLMPDGTVTFVEVKRPGGRLTEGQKREIDKLRNLGQNVFIVYDYEEVDELVELLGGHL